MRLLDTDICVDLLRGHAPTVNWLSSLTGEIAIPGYVALELYNGCLNKTDAAGVTKFLANFDTVWPTEADCAVTLSFFPDRKLSHNLGLLDALIAACTLGRGASLCIFNVKHFASIDGLVVEQPYSKAP